MGADLVTAPSTDTAQPTRPRFAYLLLTHTQPKHVEALTERILTLSPEAQVVVHHDLAAGALPWRGRAPDGVYFVERGRVLWGDWSMVEATRRLLRFATEQLEADWFVLLSGEHRPAVPLEDWERATGASGIDALVPAVPLAERLHFGTARSEANLYLARTRHQWRLYRRPRHEILHRAMGGVSKLSRGLQPLLAVEFVHRRDGWAVGTPRAGGRMRAMPVHRGSQWIAMNRRATARVLGVDPVVTAWFRTSWIPDETFFQSVLYNEPDLVVSDSPTTFVLETPEHPVPGWMRLGFEDRPAMWKAGTPFARKVDPVHRPAVMAAIDDEVDRRAQRDPRAARPHVFDAS